MDIKKLNSDSLTDFKSLIEIFKVVFENDESIANDEQLSKLLLNPDFYVFVVMSNNKVVGGLTIYVLHRYYGTRPIAYIYDVGVSPDYQGQGFCQGLSNKRFSLFGILKKWNYENDVPKDLGRPFSY